MSDRSIILDDTTIGALALSPTQQACLASIKQQKVKTFTPYYSRIWVVAERSGVWPSFTYVVPPGLVASAFGYALGDSVLPAVIGSPAAVAALLGFVPRATKAETNITKKTETNSGENVRIMGISCQLNAGFNSSALLATKSMAHVWADMIFGSDDHYVLGRLAKFGGANGLFGAGSDESAPITLNGDRQATASMTMGRPAWDNFIQIPEGIVWADTDADSNMQIDFKFERGLSYTVDGQFGPAAFSPPAFVVAAFDIELIGPVFGNRSKIS